MFHILTPPLYTDWASMVAACMILSTEGDSSISARPPAPNRSGLMPVLNQEDDVIITQLLKSSDLKRLMFLSVSMTCTSPVVALVTPSMSTPRGLASSIILSTNRLASEVSVITLTRAWHGGENYK